MLAGDLVQLDLRRSQLLELAAFGAADFMEKARELADGGDAWTVQFGSRIVACGGFLEQQSHEAVAWIALAGEIPPASRVAIVRFAARTIATTRYTRLEAAIDADNPLALALARAVGLAGDYVLRKKGGRQQDQILVERVAA